MHIPGAERKTDFVTQIISCKLFSSSYSRYYQGRKFSLEINNQV